MAGPSQRVGGSSMADPIANDPHELGWAEVTVNGKWHLTLPEHRARLKEWRTGWEVERLDSMHALLKPDDVLFDVGAEEGDLSALFASWIARPIYSRNELMPPTFGAGGVVLFEPNPHIWPNIRATWEANRLPHPLGYYVGFASDHTNDAPRALDFDPSFVHGNWPVVTLGPTIINHGFRTLAELQETTPQTTLDDWAQRHDVWPTAITIDVEGAELQVLLGARNLLATRRPKVWVSVHPQMMVNDYAEGLHDPTPADCRASLVQFMVDQRYEPTYLGTDHEEHFLFLPQP